MIKKSNKVPDKTIAVFMDPSHLDKFNFEKFTSLVKKPTKKREWFDSYFYNCLPIIIGNQQGFVITANFGFSAIWNGGPAHNDITIKYDEVMRDENGNLPILFPGVSSHFGFGTISIATPFLLKTPPGVNLMTINPPNYILKNVTVLTGSVETDNTNMPFTFNLRIHEPNVVTHFPKGTPLSGFIPVPRYFCDGFEIKDASTIFKKEVFDKEIKKFRDSIEKRLNSRKASFPGTEPKPEKDYFYGKDVYGNDFPDHQRS
jgi:hypothetical protein